MFDQILNVVKEQLANNPQAAAIPADKANDVHKEVASHIEQVITGQPGAQGALVSSLASKLGLPPAVAGAIAGALPGILQKITHKAGDPNDKSISLESITKGLGGSGGLGGGLGNILGKL